jgi:hypothetical protein
MGFISAGVIFTAFLILQAVSAFAQQANQCVACHRNLSSQEEAGHFYHVWSTSRHSRTGIACEQCHAGNPAATDKKTAHLGILPSSDSKSKTHPRQISKTCGICHFEEYVQFKQSKHSELLEKEGKGPHCVTCHSSMATIIITPEEMDQKCSQCHDTPQAWVKLLKDLNETSKNLWVAQSKAWELRQAGKDTDKIDTLLRVARDVVSDVRPRWHQYNVREINTKIRSTEVLIESATRHIEKLQKN